MLAGVEREMHVHDQPHLVPPMKLVFYDEMPQSPMMPPRSPHRVSQWVSHGRDIASRASDRASLRVRKKVSKQSITAPILITHPSDLPFRREPRYRPLELSIYLPGNRLSDLPEFEDIDFTDTGVIQLPPKALLRARSEDLLNSRSSPSQKLKPTISMVGERQLDYWQRKRASSAASQRPGSACEALNSHPVCWDSLPGLPPPTRPLQVLSPMVEEFEPSPALQPAQPESIMLEFPSIDEEGAIPEPEPTLPPSTIQIPYKQPVPVTHARLNSFNKTRISQWLTRSTTSSTAGSTHSSSKSKKPQFYQCAVSPPTAHSTPAQEQTASPATLPSSLDSPFDFTPHTHTHSHKTSTSTTLSDRTSVVSLTSATTAPTMMHMHSPGRSRSGTLHSLGKHSQFQVQVVAEEDGVMNDGHVPAMPALSGYAKGGELEDGQIVGMGVAF